MQTANGQNREIAKHECTIEHQTQSMKRLEEPAQERYANTPRPCRTTLVAGVLIYELSAS